MLTETATAQKQLRTILRAIKPASADGFEGLVATALAAMTGQIIRLASSGLQFGRDMRTSGTGFTIAAECKRYGDDLKLEHLAGKATIAARHLGGHADLWLVCATSAIGDQTVAELSELLYEQGLWMVPLDWPATGFAPLAVLLAITPAETDTWFAAHRSGDRAKASTAINALRADLGFAAAEADLRRQLDRTEAGLSALRNANADWLKARFSDWELSRRSFGQLIGLAPDGVAPLDRLALIDELGDKLRAQRTTDPPVVVITGDEGVGKTWLIPRWWMHETEPPILLLVAGRRTGLIDPAQPRLSLARLLADETGRTSQRDIGFWLRRLDRWRTQAASTLRFLLVIDGLNEHTGFPWADTLRGLAQEMEALGGMVCATVRPRFWDRDVDSRLRHGIERRKLVVPKLSLHEVKTALTRSSVEFDQLSEAVQEFLRVPRVLVVAVRLMEGRTLAPENLTIDRLMLEYWRHRLDERGDLLHHNLNDFDRLLRSHARAWLEQPRRDFDRAEWESHSRVSAFGRRRHVEDDLTEIDEGRFLTISDTAGGRYSFTPAGLPFALALLLNDELRQRLARGEGAHAVIDQIIDPIRGFDELSGVLASAIAIATSAIDFPEMGLFALIDQFTGLQNHSDEAMAVVGAHLRERPEPFLDLLEQPVRALSPAFDLRTLEGLLLDNRDAPRMTLALPARVTRWLGQWSRMVRVVGDNPEAEQARHAARIDTALTAMSPAERMMVDQLSWESAARPVGRLVPLAGLLVAGRPCAGLAAGLLGLGLTRFAADWTRDSDALAWALRLNLIDSLAVAQNLSALTGAIDETASAPVRSGTAMSLRLLGDRAGAERAERLSPLPLPGPETRQSERYCETNPMDPAVQSGTQLSNAVAAADGVDRTAAWSSFYVGSEDRTIGMIAPALARFDVDPFARLVREITLTAPSRAGMALRQVGWQVLAVTALLDDPALAAIDAALADLRADPNRLEDDDRRWIPAWMDRAVTAHEPASAQLDRLLTMPDSAELLLNSRCEWRALDPADVGPRLRNAAATDDRALTRTLFFLGTHRHMIDPSLYPLIIDAFTALNTNLASCAADVIMAADDPRLYASLLDRLAGRGSRPNGADPGQACGEAIARAVIVGRRTDRADLVGPRQLGDVAAALGGEPLRRFADQIDLVIGRLSTPASLAAPEDVDLFLGVDVGGKLISRWHEPATTIDEDEDEAAKLERFFRKVNRGLEADEAEERSFQAAAKAFLDELVAQGLDAASWDPPLAGLAAVGSAEPSRVAAWLDSVMATADPAALGRLRNLGIGLAAAVAPFDPVRAANALRRLQPVRPLVAIVYDDDRVPLYEHVVYRLPASAPFDALRAALADGARDDRAIGEQARFADIGGSHAWLDGHIDALVADVVPGKVARGLMLAGLRVGTGRSAAHLAADTGPGFLALVQDQARRHARHLEWTRHWLGQLAMADDPVAAWRAAALASRVADMRFLGLRPAPRPGWMTFADTLFEPMRKGAEKREEKRKDKLFGQKAPPALFWALYDDPPPQAPN
ncbi:DEAD/DEAH box helicase family protein [Sphingomonas sp. YL-JM2C]